MLDQFAISFGVCPPRLECNVRRTIDFHEGGKIDERSLKAFICAATVYEAMQLRQHPD
jgi:hypothetical protein